MKKLPAYIMVVALLVANIASVAHAACPDGISIDGSQIVEAMDNGSNDSENKSAGCDDCSCCHSHASLSYMKAENLTSDNQAHNSWDSKNYFSQLNSPPFQPPKA